VRRGPGGAGRRGRGEQQGRGRTGESAQGACHGRSSDRRDGPAGPRTRIGKVSSPFPPRNITIRMHAVNPPEMLPSAPFSAPPRPAVPRHRRDQEGEGGARMPGGPRAAAGPPGGGPRGGRSGTMAAMSDLRMLAPLYQPAEETGGSWHTRVHPGNSPQGGRDALAHHFLKEEAAAGGDQERAREFADAANLMDWEKHDEVAVLGHRYRIVRIERYVLFTDEIGRAHV